MMDAGHIAICKLTNIAVAGNMPQETLSIVAEADFEERYIGYGRQYDAKGVNEQVDMLVRVWREPLARIGMYAVLTDYEGQENEDGDQYRIDTVQQLRDDDGLKVTDLTLSRLEDYYDVTGEADESEGSVSGS